MSMHHEYPASGNTGNAIVQLARKLKYGCSIDMDGNQHIKIYDVVEGMLFDAGYAEVNGETIVDWRVNRGYPDLLEGLDRLAKETHRDILQIAINDDDDVRVFLADKLAKLCDSKGLKPERFSFNLTVRNES